MSSNQLSGARYLAEALQRGPLPHPPHATPLPHLGYRHGFWQYEASGLLGCPYPLWIPFLSGYGGITLLLMPNDTVYYLVSDNGEFGFADALAESHRLKSMCPASAG